MSAADQAQVVSDVEREGRGKQRRLGSLGVPRRTYYWWRRRLQAGIGKESGRHRSPWNRLRPEEEALILATALEQPTWRSRQLAAWLTDHQGLAVCATTLYRILRREGLVKRAEEQLRAGGEWPT